VTGAFCYTFNMRRIGEFPAEDENILSKKLNLKGVKSEVFDVIQKNFGANQFTLQELKEVFRDKDGEDGVLPLTAGQVSEIFRTLCEEDQLIGRDEDTGKYYIKAAA